MASTKSLTSRSNYNEIIPLTSVSTLTEGMDSRRLRFRDPISASSKLTATSNYDVENSEVKFVQSRSSCSKTSYKAPHKKEELVELGKEGFIVLDEVLGKGTYANVYKTMYKKSGSVYENIACKIIDTLKAPEKFVNEFLPRELCILRHISHRNIVKVHSIRILPQFSKVYIFMERCDQDLFEYLLKHKKVAENQAMVWFYQALCAVQYLHDREIAHRDIKCTNLLLKNNEVKLADFGFATICVNSQSHTRLSTTYCGSDEYAAPELLSGSPYYPKKVDIWALGVVLFTMVNGCMPFTKDVKKKYRQQITKQWKHQIHVTQSLRNLTEKLLEPEPSERLTVQRAIQSPWLNIVRKK